MLQISPIPAFDDNYIWLLLEPGNERVAVVDPGDEEPVLERLSAEGLTLAAILITHKHGDHVGGVAGLKEAFPGARVYGPAGEPVRLLDQALGEGEEVAPPGVAWRLRVMAVPGHTEGHVAYYGHGVLFCGDTLFCGGCGRIFSGTHEQMHASLQRIAALPPQTLIYCAHEYTEASLGFALWVEPDNAALHRRIAECSARRQAGEPTVPSSLALELATNPFLRTAEAGVSEAARRYAGRPNAKGAEIFTALRTWKDREYD
ncbi:MAG: hydroxyacylglutathione hydrolase [Candidatus Sedimenticola endophacoides]